MYYAFYLCSNLKTLPENTTDSFAEVTTFKYAFEGCSGLQTIPASLFSGCDKVTDVLGCFTKDVYKRQVRDRPGGVPREGPRHALRRLAGAGPRRADGRRVPGGIYGRNDENQ